eukprot:GHVU01064505.1.p1 GENE.GHVU01064505.1~~GHVU01064505.1.p1  ORF type:complete len:260 (+),score=36.44 GHVU01064505.1:654-1433(+)
MGDSSTTTTMYNRYQDDAVVPSFPLVGEDANREVYDFDDEALSSRSPSESQNATENALLASLQHLLTIYPPTSTTPTEYDAAPTPQFPAATGPFSYGVDAEEMTIDEEMTSRAAMDTLERALSASAAVGQGGVRQPSMPSGAYYSSSITAVTSGRPPSGTGRGAESATAVCHRHHYRRHDRRQRRLYHHYDHQRSFDVGGTTTTDSEHHYQDYNSEQPQQHQHQSQQPKRYALPVFMKAPQPHALPALDQIKFQRTRWQ